MYKRQRLHAVDDALGDLETLLRGPYGGAARAGLGALVAPTAARHLALFREQFIPRYGAWLSDDVALVEYLARASDDDARKPSTAIVSDLAAQAPRLFLSSNSNSAFGNALGRLRSPSASLIGAIGRSEFPDLDDASRRAAARDYVGAAVARQPRYLSLIHI